MDFYSIGVNHEAGPYRKNKTAPISMTSDTYFKTLLPAIFSALHNQTCWYIAQLFLPFSKTLFLQRLQERTAQNTGKYWQVQALQPAAKTMNMAAKKLPVQYSFPAFEGVNNLLQQNMPLLEPFFGFLGGFRVGKYRLKAQGFKQLQKLHGGSDPKLRDRPVAIPSWISEQQECWDSVGSTNSDKRVCCYVFFSIWILIHWILWKFGSKHWENFVQQRLVHQGNLLNFPTCSGSLREIKNHHSSHSGRIPWLDDGRYLIQNSFCWGWRPFRRKCSKSSIHVHPPYHSWPAGS